MDTIEGMRVFAAVSRQASFTGGAKRLGISTNLASKYVRQLEQRLGAQLLNRTTRSVTLTEAGQAYYKRCLALIEQFDELETMVQQNQTELAGPIRITAPTAFGSRQLVKAIAPFQLANPKVAIDLRLSDHLVDIIDEGFDIAIRFGRLHDSSFIARKLLDMPYVVFASPEYLRQHGEPSHPSALAAHNCLLQLSSANPHLWSFILEGKKEVFRVEGSFRANSPRSVAYMAAAGLGIGRCPFYIAEPLINRGELQLLFSDNMLSKLSLYAIYPSKRHLTLRVRALIDHLVSQFKHDYSS